jgi:hypothetical protein
LIDAVVQKPKKRFYRFPISRNQKLSILHGYINSQACCLRRNHIYLMCVQHIGLSDGMYELSDALVRRHLERGNVGYL